MSDLVSASDPMRDALLASMPSPLAGDALGIRDLFIVSGCVPREARRKVAELCNHHE